MPPNFRETYPSSDLLCQGVLFNCSARIEHNSFGHLEPKGNCTEVGLIKYLMRSGVSVQDLIREKEGKILQTIPFNSRRKRASTVVQLPNETVRVFLKGAPEIVMEYCEKWIDRDGTVKELDEEKRRYIINDIVTHTFAKRAYRTIMIAYGDIS
jgi:magnesium-transporting ATPase (P-type)